MEELFRSSCNLHPGRPKRTADLTFWEKLHIVGAPDQRNTTTSNQRTTTFVFQSKMQRIGENISIAWFPSTNSWLIDPPTQNRSGSISWGPLTGENPRPCYYGQSVRRSVRSPATLITASHNHHCLVGSGEGHLVFVLGVYSMKGKGRF